MKLPADGARYKETDSALIFPGSVINNTEKKIMQSVFLFIDIYILNIKT